MHHELQARVRGQVHAIILEIDAGKRREKMKVPGSERRHHLRELQQDLGQVVAVPLGLEAIHWRSCQNQEVGVQLTELGDHSSNLLQGGLDARLNVGRGA